MSWTLCLSGPAIARAGTHANSTLIVYGGNNKTILDAYSDAAEGRVCGDVGEDLVTNIASYSAVVLNAIKDAVEHLIAMDIVAYDNTGYSAREADMIMNKCNDRYNQALGVLRKKENLKI